MLVAEQTVEPDPSRALDALFMPGFDFRRRALVDADAPPAGTPGPPAGPWARITRETANVMTIDVACDSESTLVVLDSYNAGWRAEVDGVEARLARADGLFRAVRLAPGVHTVEMRYVPPGLAVGGAISAASAIALAWLALRGRGRAGRAPHDAS
jgi:hypothetical protein